MTLCLEKVHRGKPGRRQQLILTGRIFLFFSNAFLLFQMHYFISRRKNPRVVLPHATGTASQGARRHPAARPPAPWGPLLGCWAALPFSP